MMSLAMMGLTLGPMVRVVFLFTFMNPLVVLETPLVVLNILLVVSVVWGLKFLSWQESIQLVTLFHWPCLYQKESSPEVVES